MRQKHSGSEDQHAAGGTGHGGHGHGGGHHAHGHRHHGGGRHGGRPFDYGELRLVMLAMIAEQPRHGYELIKAIGERMGGGYTPSPGVIYPTLAMLDELGHATVAAHGAGRKQYSITPEGCAYLAAHKAAVDGLMARLNQHGRGERGTVPPDIVQAMEKLKLSLRLRLARGFDDAGQTARIASALDDAARAVETC